jgi:MoaA/NifB/PqqE/SkfB family radical SAM enzyme
MALFNYRNHGRLCRVYGRSLFQYGSIKKTLNAVRTELAYRRRAPRVESLPFILFLEPLYYCNLDCPLCDRQVFPEARAKDAGRLTLDLFDRILDEVGDYLFQCQLFGQGEPMLDWDLTRRIIQRCHRRNIFTLVSTNSTLITPQIAEEVVSCGLDYLVCAIDGISQQSYEIYRTGGKYADAMAGMRMILDQARKQKSKILIEWQFLVHAGNSHEVETAKKLAEELGVFIRFAPLRGMEWDRDLEKSWVPAQGNTGPKPMSPGEFMNPWPCYFLWRSLVLNSNGKAARCLIYQNVSQYASLHEQTVREVYNHSSVQQARRLFRKEVSRDRSSEKDPAPAPCISCGYFKRRHSQSPTSRRAAVALPLFAEHAREVASTVDV